MAQIELVLEPVAPKAKPAKKAEAPKAAPVEEQVVEEEAAEEVAAGEAATEETTAAEAEVVEEATGDAEAAGEPSRRPASTRMRGVSLFGSPLGWRDAGARIRRDDPPTAERARGGAADLSTAASPRRGVAADHGG